MIGNTENLIRRLSLLAQSGGNELGFPKEIMYPRRVAEVRFSQG